MLIFQKITVVTFLGQKIMNCSSASIDELNGIDWSFPSLTNNGIHSFHWYPATYIAAIPGTLISQLTKKDSIVLDPFCGSGTTGVEAIRLGRQFVGIDTNPIALLISQAKLYFPDPNAFNKAVSDIVSSSDALFFDSKQDEHPQLDELREWYHPETLFSLHKILIAILKVHNANLKKCLLAIFSGVLKSCSSQGKHWGWVCDNVKPKKNEIVYKDAISIFLNASHGFIESSSLSHKEVRVHKEHETRKNTRSRSTLLSGSCISQMERMRPNSVDFIMTSPPYYGVADYIKSQRLSFLWFDMDELSKERLGFRDFESLRKYETGARSFRSRKNSHSTYIEFMNIFFQQSFSVLKDGAHMALVVGESKARAATTDLLIKSAKINGFELKLKEGRDIKPSRRRLMAKVQGESILIFQK
ncbi:DNA methyltransferase [Vreelandella venusta]|uniref:DNA methyltransferase n=1 Tax=Vreelandella venusta TaxID=44935 RepID=UPI00384ADD15